MSKRQIKALREYGPIIVALGLAVILDQSQGVYWFTLAPLFAALAMGIYKGTPVTYVSITVIISVYALYSLYDISLIRAAIIIISLLLIVIPFGHMRRSIDNTGTLYDRVREVDILLSGLQDRWYNLSDTEKLTMLATIHHKVANILTLIIGWLSLAKVESEYRDR